ncbi:hypothetical protein VPH35_016841 [Triticum aestivum]
MAAGAKPPPATTLQDVPDRLMEPILARLMSSPLCLVRAAATCKRWRRIMGRSWLFASELQRAHPPAPNRRPVAGNYYNRVCPLGGREIVFVPTAPAAQHRVESRHFSLDFLPGGSRKWEVVDSSRSLVLLAKKKKSGWMRRSFPDLVVCEPATRRYQLIPRMEEMKRHRCLGSHLVGTERNFEFKPGGGMRVADSMETFKVVCVVYQGYDGVRDDIGAARACFFARNDSKTQPRRGRPETHSWYAEQSHDLGNNVCLHAADSLHFLGHAGGSLYWSIKGHDERMLALGGRWLPHNFQGTVLQVTDDSTRWKRENAPFGSILHIFVISNAIHFSLDFLPGGCRKWEVVDSSRSLVLLAKKRKGGWARRCFPSLLVCEPATRRYQLIPRMEEMKHHRCLGSYLVGTERCTEFKPSGGRRLLDTMQTFKVVCVLYQGHDGVCDDVGSARACIFARKTEVRKGRPEAHSWYAERSRCLGYNVHLHGADSLHFLGHAEGSLFWSIKGDNERRLVSYGGPWLPENFNGTVLRVTDDSAYENWLKDVLA